MTYTPADFGPGKDGPAIAWLIGRLAVHGYWPRWDANLQEAVRLFQLAQGWTGAGADGLPGPQTIARLTADPTPTPTPEPVHGVDVSDWKITLPTPIGGDDPEEVYPIRDFEVSPWFIQRSDGSVSFRAPCNGAHTENSSYSRSELREMNPDGSKSSWSNTSGAHTMTIDQAITHLPVAKPHVVAGQVHDAKTKVLMIRLEGTELFVESPYASDQILDANYVLGTRFNIRIHASGGIFIVEYNGVPKATVGRASGGLYFKAGCYIQSNTSKGDKPDAYGEVVIYSLDITHV